MSRRASQDGIALVESLVATLLLGIGLGGGVALLVQAIAAEREAAVRGTALRHACSLADELRLMLRGRGGVIATLEPGLVPDCTAPGVACTPAEWVALRVDRWRADVLDELPVGASAGVETLQASPPAYRISLSWPARVAGIPNRVELAVEP